MDISNSVPLKVISGSLEENKIKSHDKPENDEKEEKETAQNSNKNPQSKCYKFIIIIIIIVLSIVILCLISLLIYKKVKKNKKAEEKSNEPIIVKNDEIDNQNKITTLYIVEDGQWISFFNEKELNLTNGDFIVVEKSFSKNNLRYLNILETNESMYTPKNNGNLTVEISFKKNLTSLKNLFKNNNNLIKVDLKDFNMENVVTMESTFSGCSNLNEVDLEGVDSKNLLNMNKAFEKCKKLEKVNLSMKNISKLLDSNYIFADCENLQLINLSSLQNINKNMFLGLKSNLTIQANELISNELKYIFHINLNITINIIIKTINESNDCIKGSDDKCKECSTIIKKNCATCNDGFYLPFNSTNKEKCLSCNTIDHCNFCIEYEKNIFCYSCKEGFVLKNNICEKQNIIPLCQIGNNELCKSCNSDINLRNECSTCNEGYYLPSDSENKTICENCNKIIKDCIECSGTSENPECLKCKEGYKLENNFCIEKSCDIGDEDKCKTCKNEIGKKIECESCNDGYYLEENKISYKCSKCSIKNCKNAQLMVDLKYAMNV